MSFAKYKPICSGLNALSHWDGVATFDSDNGLSPVQRQAIIWTMQDYCQLDLWQQVSMKSE